MALNLDNQNKIIRMESERLLSENSINIKIKIRILIVEMEKVLVKFRLTNQAKT